MPEALDFFHQPPYRYNCAQSVAAGAGADAQMISDLASAGGGRAPDGCCGALYAAMLMSAPGNREALTAEFRERAGAVTCRELKQVCHFPCEECVKLGAELQKKFKA